MAYAPKIVLELRLSNDAALQANWLSEAGKLIKEGLKDSLKAGE